MRQDSLLGMVYHAAKDGIGYQITYPRSVMERPEGRTVDRYRFAVKPREEKEYTYTTIDLTNTLSASLEISDLNLLLGRALYGSIGTNTAHIAFGTNFDRAIVEGKADDQFQVRLRVLEYLRDRQDNLWDENCTLFELFSAVDSNPAMIARQIVFLHTKGAVGLSSYQVANFKQDNWGLFLSQPIEVTADDDLFESLISRTSLKANVGMATGSPVVFMSYNSRNKVLAGSIKAWFEENLDCSVFLAHEDIQPSEEWVERIESELQECRGVVALLTDEFRESDWTSQELGIAHAYGKPIIQLMCPRNPFGFAGKYQGLRIDAENPAKSLSKHQRILRSKLGIHEPSNSRNSPRE